MRRRQVATISTCSGRTFSWIEWWRSVSYGEERGTFSLGAPVTHEGGTSVTVSAPISEIPMFVEAGAVIPLLAPDVFTLAEYGSDPEIVHASDRDHLLHVLAFPRGETAGAMYADESWASAEADGQWTLTMVNDRERTIHLEAAMQTLAVPFDVCGVNLDGNPLAEEDWSYDEETGVLEASYTTTSGVLSVEAC